MAVRRLPATPGWICVLNNYQNNVYIIVYVKAYKLYIYVHNNIGFRIIYVCVEQWSREMKMTQVVLFTIDRSGQSKATETINMLIK